MRDRDRDTFEIRVLHTFLMGNDYMAVLLSCQAISKAFGNRQLFENFTFGVNDGERLGLIGPNGSGKSTLLKLLAQVEALDSGVLSVRRGLRWGYVAQEEAFAADVSAAEVLTAALHDQHLDAAKRDHRVDRMLDRIGFSDIARRAPMETLSGGWRKRVALARELVREPDLLFMDEPTNHLDLEGILWLERLLAHAAFAFVLVSHDRLFLEHTTNRIVELNRRFPEGSFSAPGTYSDFLLKREEFLDGQLKTQKSLESKVRRESEWLKRGPPARTTKSRARIDEAGRLIQDLAETRMRNTQGTVSIDFVSTKRQANKLLLLKNVGKRLGERTLIENLDLRFAPGMKVGLLGGNGCGKTTLLRLLSGELDPDSGEIERAEQLRVVYFDQNREQLDKDLTLRRALSPLGDTLSYRGQPVHVSAWAQRFLFLPEQLDMPIWELSGGEQARVMLARMMLKPADMLLLDEPTNDLDIPSLEVLEDSLEEFPGAVVLVTHDRFMLRKLSTTLLGLDGLGGVRQFSSYEQWETAQTGTSRTREDKTPKEAQPKTLESGESPKKNKKLSYKEKLEWERMEATILATEAHVQVLQKELEAPTMASDIKKLQAHCQTLAEAQAGVERLYTRWQELEAKQL